MATPLSRCVGGASRSGWSYAGGTSGEYLIVSDVPTSAVSAGEVTVVVVESFDVFVRREQRGLVALAIGLTGNVQDAQDVVQDVLIAASRRWATVGAYESPAAWARRAVANRSTSVLRRKAAQARRFSSARQPSRGTRD